MYSTYADLILLINGLPSGTTFEVTSSWCIQNGLNVSTDLPKRWGRKLKSEYAQHKLIYLGKSSNNLCHYQKI